MSNSIPSEHYSPASTVPVRNHRGRSAAPFVHSPHTASGTRFAWLRTRPDASDLLSAAVFAAERCRGWSSCRGYAFLAAAIMNAMTQAVNKTRVHYMTYDEAAATYPVGTCFGLARGGPTASCAVFLNQSSPSLKLAASWSICSPLSVDESPSGFMRDIESELAGKRGARCDAGHNSSP